MREGVRCAQGSLTDSLHRFGQLPCVRRSVSHRLVSVCRTHRSYEALLIRRRTHSEGGGAVAGTRGRRVGVARSRVALERALMSRCLTRGDGDVRGLSGWNTYRVSRQATLGPGQSHCPARGACGRKGQKRFGVGQPINDAQSPRTGPREPRMTPGPVVVRTEDRWRSTENENGHRAVCTGCIRPHSHELVVPLQHFGCMSQPTWCGVQPSTATIQPGYNRSTTRVQPQRIAAARIARACLVLWLWVMAREKAGARIADDVMGMVGGGGGGAGARRAGWVDVVQSRL